MSITCPIFQKASFYLEKYGRETGRNAQGLAACAGGQSGRVSTPRAGISRRQT